MKFFLETARTYLRKMGPEDFSEIAAMLKDPEVMYAWEYRFKDEDVLLWISKNTDSYAQGGLGYFLMADKNSGAIIGQAALKPDTIDGRLYYEIGYILKKEHWGKGYASEAASALLAYAKESFPGSDIIFEIRPENEKSIRVAERLGAKAAGSFLKTVRGREMKHLIYRAP